MSSSVEAAADQIAMWPDNNHPTHLSFVCDEETTNPAVQRVDLSKAADGNATTIVIGLTSSDPVRRTPWGRIIVAEEAGATDGCVRFAWLRDTSLEPSGFIFLGSGEAAFVHLQHRSVGDANHRGSLMMISGFKVNGGDHDHDRDDRN